MARNIIEESWSTKKVKKALSKGQPVISSLKNSNNSETNNRNEIINEITKFYSNLFSDKRTSEDFSFEEVVNNYDLIEVPEILEVEVESVLKNLNSNKVSGPDTIKNSSLKAFASP